MFGANLPHRDGVVLSAEEIRKDPYFSDGFPLPYLYGAPEEYLTADGFRCLGYCFGEWGAMPYHSSLSLLNIQSNSRGAGPPRTAMRQALLTHR